MGLLKKSPEELYEKALKSYEANNFSSAYNNFVRAANGGYIPAYYKLAEMYEYGLGVEKADTYLLAAVRGGNTDACETLANIYRTNLYDRGNLAKGIYWTRRACKNGSPFDKYALGILYLERTNLPELCKEGRQLIEEAAKEGEKNSLEWLQEHPSPAG